MFVYKERWGSNPVFDKPLLFRVEYSSLGLLHFRGQRWSSLITILQHSDKAALLWALCHGHPLFRPPQMGSDSSFLEICLSSSLTWWFNWAYHLPMLSFLHMHQVSDSYSPQDQYSSLSLFFLPYILLYLVVDRETQRCASFLCFLSSLLSSRQNQLKISLCVSGEDQVLLPEQLQSDHIRMKKAQGLPVPLFAVHELILLLERWMSSGRPRTNEFMDQDQSVIAEVYLDCSQFLTLLQGKSIIWVSAAI